MPTSPYTGGHTFFIIMQNKRIFVEKREQFRVEASSLLAEFNENLSLNLKTLSIRIRRV